MPARESRPERKKSTEPGGFQYGKGEVVKKKGTRAETKVTPDKKGGGKVKEAKNKNPTPRRANPRSR
jgi:hypothetical protein